jgi:nicotinate-nucleotide pyrophosphorylase (carboxylating)
MQFIKDNHLAGVQIERLAATVFEMLNEVADAGKTPSFVEVEAASLAQLRALCNVVGIDVILLDNFSVPQLAEAVQYRDALGLRGKVELEASGGVTLHKVRAIADTGVERISVGALTHSAPAIDMSLERL